MFEKGGQKIAGLSASPPRLETQGGCEPGWCRALRQVGSWGARGLPQTLPREAPAAPSHPRPQSLPRGLREGPAVGGGPRSQGCLLGGGGERGARRPERRGARVLSPEGEGGRRGAAARRAGDWRAALPPGPVDTVTCA